MRLERIRIFGFKTFADRTDIQVGAGLAAVVGPNGCGKSNIVDAILWALGETNPRELRAQSAADVIFSGSARRRPLGHAEVTLVFDNEDGGLADAPAEVAITRRIDRSGESQFFINKCSCRLKDVHELLADSGLGRSGYAIVGQKEIDGALAATPEERRAWVDEAAGVQKYRAMRTDSLRRLASAADHIQRLDDVLREVDRQRGPLVKQAEVAQRYRTVRQTLQRLETEYLIAELASAVGACNSASASLRESAAAAEREARAADLGESASKSALEQATLLEAQIELVRDSVQQKAAEVQRLQTAIDLYDQRLLALGDSEALQLEDAQTTEQRLDQARAEAEQAAMELANLQEAAETLHAFLLGSGAEAKLFQQRLDEIDGQLANARSLEVQHMRREAELAHAAARLADARRELKGVRLAAPDTEAAVQEAAEALGRAQAEAESARGELAEAEKRLETLSAEHADVTRAAGEATARLEALQARRRGLRATLEQMEGLSSGAAAVLEAARDGRLPGEFLPLASLLNVPRQYSAAIEAALGSDSSALVADSAKSARAAISFLRAERLGRATIHVAGAPAASKPEPAVKGHSVPGVLGVAIDFVKCDPKFRALVSQLLDGVLVVADLPDGVPQEPAPGWRAIVSLDGQVLRSSGSYAGGAAADESLGFLERQAEVAELDGQIAALSASVAGTAERLTALTERLEEERSALAPRRESATRAAAAQAEAERWVEKLRTELQELAKSEQRLNSEIARLMQPLPVLQPLPDLSELLADRDRLLALGAAGLESERQARDRIAELQAELVRASARLKAANARTESLLSSETKRDRRLKSIAEEREQIVSARASATADLLGAQADAANLRADLEDRRALLEEHRKQAEQHLAEARSARSRAATLNQAAHTAELERARADARRAQNLQRLLEEYGITEERALQAAPRIVPVPDGAEQVARLRRELKSFGDVNLTAIEELEELTSRYDELGSQRDDVLEGKAEIERAIEELDAHTRDRFQSAFVRLQVAFGEFFTMLFGGGEGILELTHPKNLLETGVQLEAQVPGKRRQRLELLSGGERALCACAFHLALLKVRPSPLVVLDEVDAPLDGRNVERFLEAVRSIGQTQFLVITHNPTTIEAADLWLGVTMQEPGVSSVLPFRLPGRETAVLAAV